MRIDAHQHFWKPGQFPYPWMPEGESPLRRNYLPEDLRPYLDESRFDGCVTVQASMSLGETHWLLDLAREHDWILGVVGWVDLQADDLGAVLDQLQRDPKFKGVRHPVHDEADTEWLLRPKVLAGLGELERRAIPYDLLLRPVHLPLVPRLAERFPALPMVIDHLAKPLIKDRVLEGWSQDLERASLAPNLYCKISGMITEADWKAWTSEDLRPYVQRVLELFGPSRSMFGSDWPVCRLAGSWKQVLAGFTQACGALPRQTREEILGGTASRFYRLLPD